MTTIPTCDRCGHPHVTPHGHQACAKHKSKRDPGGNLVPCSAPPVTGTDACRSHGASASQVRRAAAVNAAEAEAARQVAVLGVKVDTSPTEALLDLVQWTAGEVLFWREQVAQLNDTELTWGKTKTVAKPMGPETTEQAGPHVAYRMLTAASDRLATYAAAALKAGVEERRIRLAEAQGDLVAEVIRRILDALNLTPEQQQLVPVIVPQQLRLIAGGAA